MLKIETIKSNIGLKAEDIILPSLELVQKNSPCLNMTHPVHINEAIEGMMFNDITHELYGNSVNLVPVYCHEEFKVWKDCQSSGEFVGTFSSLGQAITCKRSQENPDDCRVDDASDYICLLLKKDGSVEEIAVSNAVIGLTASRKWRSLIRMVGGASFSRVYELSTVGRLDIYSPGDCSPLVSINGFTDEMVCRRAIELYEQAVQ